MNKEIQKELEKVYEEYFPFKHQNCSDECNKKDYEIIMRQDFVDEIIKIFENI